MFSEELLGEIYTDDRMRSVPLEYQSTVLRVVHDVLSSYLKEVGEYLSKEELLINICGGDENEQSRI